MDSSLITVRFWAGARAAAGVAEITLDTGEGVTLSALVARAVDAVAAERRVALSHVVGACSVLVDGQGIAGRAPEDVVVAPGQVVELLPPFAGG